MFVNHLKLITLRHVETIHERALDRVADGGDLRSRPSFNQIDTYKRHEIPLLIEIGRHYAGQPLYPFAHDSPMCVKMILRRSLVPSCAPLGEHNSEDWIDL